MKPTNALDLKNKGNDYFKSGDYEKALQCYGKAIEADPEYRDAWNNIYITLLKLERTDDAKKCKEILDKLTFEPDGAPGKDTKVMKSSFGRKVFKAVIVIMLLISIAISTLAVLGWINSQGATSGSPEHILSGVLSNISGIFPAPVNNSTVIAGNNSGNTYVSKNVVVTAVRYGNTIELRNYGGADNGVLTAFIVRVDDTVQESKLGIAVGSSISITGNPGQKSHIVVTGKFSDGTEQVVLDTYI
ncbi:MAG TPA: tetratricopeptide repeat protein [Methanoregulaceae archaeon]|nr:tetratricopeptide repeat protein [Methanoregulaceae archaeon]